MVHLLVAFLLGFGQSQSPAASTAPQNQTAPSAVGNKIDPKIAAKLSKVKRIYVDSFGDDSTSRQLQAMLVNSLSESKRFIVTENKDKADAVLKGTGLEKSAQEFHAISEGTAVGTAAGAEHGSVSGQVSNGNGSISGSRNATARSDSLAASDSQASTTTVNDARLAVRLVSTDGDVIWTTTKESRGAKYKGASADVADQVVKQLIWDLDKLNPPKDQ